MNLCKALLSGAPSPAMTGWVRMRLSQRQFVLQCNRNRRAVARGALLDFGHRLDPLRHRFLLTSETYTKVDVLTLRQIAQPRPGGEGMLTQEAQAYLAERGTL